MNLLIAITDEYLSLPLWVWIIIAVVVVVAIIVIVVMSAKIVRTKRRMREEQAQPVEHTAEVNVAAYDEPESEPQSAPAREPDPEPEPEPESAPAPKAEPKPKTEPKPEAKPASKPAPELKPEPVPEPKPEPAAQGERREQVKVYHITKRSSDGKWQVKFSKGKKAIKLFDTQAEAIEYAKQLAVNQEAGIMIHKEDGSFRKLRYDKSNN